MAYSIRISKKAAKEFKKIDSSVQHRVQIAIDGLKDEPRPSGVKKLKGADDLWRIRVGDYRIIYAIEDDEVIVLILRVRHRRDAY